jgi:hypothetical protein
MGLQTTCNQHSHFQQGALVVRIAHSRNKHLSFGGGGCTRSGKLHLSMFSRTHKIRNYGSPKHPLVTKLRLLGLSTNTFDQSVNVIGFGHPLDRSIQVHAIERFQHCNKQKPLNAPHRRQVLSCPRTRRNSPHRQKSPSLPHRPEDVICCPGNKNQNQIDM